MRIRDVVGSRHWTYVACAISVLAAIMPCQAQVAQSSYSDLLKRVAATPSRTRDGIVHLLMPGSGRYPPGPRFVGIKGLNQPDAIPFLVGVLRDGPDWSDAELTEGRREIARSLARCYAALCLGPIRDAQAFEPLVQTLRDKAIAPAWEYPEAKKGEYHPRRCAAMALGYLGDRRAVGPLVEVLKEEGFVECIYALGRLQAAEVAPTIIAVASERDLFGVEVHHCLESMLRIRLDARYRNEVFGEGHSLKVGRRTFQDVYRTLWQHWERTGDSYAREQFRRYYPQWKAAVRDRPQAKSLQGGLMEKMLRGGVATLPHVMVEVEGGDGDLAQALARLTGQRQLKGRSAQQCLEWWRDNQQKWQILSPSEQRPEGGDSPR